MLFFKTNNTDYSTNDVLDWVYLLSTDTRVNRLNDQTCIKEVSIRLSNNNDQVSYKANMNGEWVALCDVDNYWYRRGNYAMKSEGALSPVEERYNETKFVNGSFVIRAINTFLERNGQKIINKEDQMQTNKISNLLLAAESGLTIPETLVSNDGSDIVRFIHNYERIIVKEIDCDKFKFSWNKEFDMYVWIGPWVTTNTHLAERLKIVKDMSRHSPLVYQQYIEKRYELRIFYLKGSFFSMAIFSQENEKTKIDFRNYDDERPNRCTPYKLPPAIEQSLDKFMKASGINCGSIDMIYTPDGRHVFLEVNPLGQYQWLEKNCNYPISKSIAEDLLSNENKK